MATWNLTSNELQLLQRCLLATADGPFFPDWEFHALFGQTRSEFADTAKRLSDLDDCDPALCDAVNSALNNLLGYPHGKESALREWLAAPIHDVETLYEKWQQLSRKSGP